MIAVPDPSSEPSLEELKENYEKVCANVQRVAKESGEVNGPVRLVAVSKTKTVACLQRAYDVGVRIFGENYVQEICDKAPLLPGDIQWRFIGHLQSNKAKDIVSKVPSLVAIETIDSESLATKVNNAVEKHRPDRPLDVYVQVNTSGEESKFGVEPGKPVVDLARHVIKQCPKLTYCGLMTIGMPDYSSRPECFAVLNACKKEVIETLGAEGLLPQGRQFEMSMGMSGDYEAAIACGSTNVRVGSSIFGARVYKPKEEVKKPEEDNAAKPEATKTS